MYEKKIIFFLLLRLINVGYSVRIKLITNSLRVLLSDHSSFGYNDWEIKDIEDNGDLFQGNEWKLHKRKNERIEKEHKKAEIENREKESKSWQKNKEKDKKNIT